MTEFESTLTAALRAEAEEISMTIDQQRAADELRTRLDHADRTRSRRTWTVVLAVAAALAVVFVGIRVLGSRADAPPIQPAPSPSASQSLGSAAKSFTKPTFVRPFSVEVPAWATAPDTFVNTVGDHLVSIEQSGCVPASPCDWPADYKIRVLAPVGYYAAPGAAKQSPVLSREAFVAHLRSLPGQSVSDVVITKVDGHPATVLTESTTGGDGAAFGCERATDAAPSCWGTQADVSGRLAYIDAPGGPLLIWIRVSNDNPGKAQAFADFDHMLTTIRFTG